MRTHLRHLRPLAIGLVALLFTAGIAFAGKPTTVPNGRTLASEAAGKTVPVQAEPGDEQEADEDENVEADEDAETDEESEDASDNCTTDPTGLSEQELGDMRHGSVVCWAAQQETPEGYDNHGAWVSEWAKQNHGADASEGAGDAAGDHVPDKAAGHVGQGKSHKP